MYIDIPTYPAGALLYLILVQNKTSTDFVCLGYASQESYFTRYQISYIAISNLLGNIYYFEQTCVLNTILAWPASIDFPFTNPAIKNIGQDYYYVLSINHFSIGYQQLVAPNLIIVTLIANSANSYTIKINTNGLFVYSIGVEGFLIDPGLINNLALKNVLITYYYTHPGPAGYFKDVIFQYGAIALSPSNAFFGLQYFYSVNNAMDYEINVINSQSVVLTKFDTVSDMGFHIFVFFRNHCNDPFYYDQKQGFCRRCAFNCLSCDDRECFQCSDNFTLSPDLKTCQCQYPIVSSICYDFASTLMKGCISAVTNPTNIIECITCSTALKLIAANNQCNCIDGYQFDPSGICVQTCGDGRLYQLHCDDNNTLDGDGCDSKCEVEVNFICDNSIMSSPSVCKSKQQFRFKLVQIVKNQNNSAIVKFETDEDLMFPMQYGQFIDENGHNRFKIKLQNTSDSSSQHQLQTHLISAENNQITFLIDYGFTIECMNSQLQLDLSEQKYTTQSVEEKFQACGGNQPLLFSQYHDIFIILEYLFTGISYAIFFLFIISLLAPKYIGLQAILTLQLIYFSSLLIVDIENYPIGFRVFASFLYSNGYILNFLFSQILFNFKQNEQNKIVWMGLHKTIIQNYNLSFLLLLLSGIFLVLTSYYQSKKQSIYQKRSSKYTKIQLETMKENLQTSIKWNNYAYHGTNQIGIWCILQVMASVGIQIMIKNQNVKILQNSFLLRQRWLVIIVSSMIIGMVGTNHFNNILISRLVWGKMCRYIGEITYKKINYIYVVVIGSAILFFHNTMLFSYVPISAVVLFIHIAYFIALNIIKPYKMSLNAHSYALNFFQFVYLVFLIFINLINFSVQISELIVLLFALFIAICSFVILILTIIRLYYQYRYGEILEKKVVRQRELKKSEKFQKQQIYLKRTMKKYQSIANQQLNQRQLKRLQNKYLMENQIKQDLMNQQIQFLNNRPNLNQEQKQKYYFKKFNKKPLEWINNNNIQQYQKRVAEQSNKKKIQKEKDLAKYIDPQYIQITQKLKKQFHRLSKMNKQKIDFKSNRRGII